MSDRKLEKFPSSRLSHTKQDLVAAGGCWFYEDGDGQQLLRLPLALPFLSSSSRTGMGGIAARSLPLYSGDENNVGVEGYLRLEVSRGYGLRL